MSGHPRWRQISDLLLQSATKSDRMIVINFSCRGFDLSSTGFDRTQIECPRHVQNTLRNRGVWLSSPVSYAGDRGFKSHFRYFTRGLSSVGRASHLHCEGRRIIPDRLHYRLYTPSRKGEKVYIQQPLAEPGLAPRLGRGDGSSNLPGLTFNPKKCRLWVKFLVLG